MPFKKYLARVPPTPSIVVLPFVDMSSDKSQQPFCDGLTEELSSWLAQLPSLRVVARTSAFSFKDKPTDVREIGRQLGTTYVLEGSMRRTGDYMRISVQLIDARTGYHRWAGAYDAPVIDVIKVQEDIARSIATNLEIRLAKLTQRGLRGARQQQRRGLPALPDRPASPAVAHRARTTTAPSSCTSRRSPQTPTLRSPTSDWCTPT